ncbi:unnamed protein product [Auanema sp. JU1783]|nr:unnamed protein product [Auanema sp. JU1783]
MSDIDSVEHSTSSSSSIDEKLPSRNNLIRGREGVYAVGKTIAQGRYGAVYEVLRKRDGKPFACKLEVCDTHSHGLDMDYTLMNIASKRGSEHLNWMIDRGKIEEHFKFLIMPLHGDNLLKVQSLFEDGRFSLSTGLRLGLMTLSALEEIHNMGFVHRDIKPSNFCFSPSSSSPNFNLILIDYGIARAHVHKNGEVRTPRTDVRFRGTSRYASVAAHRGEEQAPKDDLESWLYMIVEWLSGLLPWSSLHKDNLDDIKKLKEQSHEDDGSEVLLKFCPKVEFRRIMKHLDGLTYRDKPNYSLLHEILQLAMTNNGVKMDDSFDWLE